MGHPAATGDDVCLGAIAGAVPQYGVDGVLQAALLREAGVAVSPGVGFGEYGEGYVRLGLVENEQRIRQAAKAVKRVLESAETLAEG